MDASKDNALPVHGEPAKTWGCFGETRLAWQSLTSATT